MSTIFIVRAIPFLLMLIVSIVLTYTGLYQVGIPSQVIFTSYSPLTILIIIAWIVSRALFNTRLHSFFATREVEEAKNNLDTLVKERTAELSDTNKRLLEEISERIKNEKTLESAKKKVQEADQLKSVFLANMSHEIRTPLNGIIGFGELLKNPKLTNEKRDRYLEIIARNSQQLLKIIDDILDISLIESYQIKIDHVKFRLNQLFLDAIENYKNYKHIQEKDHIAIINAGFHSKSDDTVISDPLRI